MIKKLTKNHEDWMDILNADGEMFDLGVSMATQIFSKDELKPLCKSLNQTTNNFFFLVYNDSIVRIQKL